MTLIREMTQADLQVLPVFLYEAIFVPEGAAPPPPSVIHDPALQVYIKGFGEGVMDAGVLAERDGLVVGAAWARIMNDFGHVDDNTPSCAISVLKDYRGRGIGTRLMTALFQTLKAQGAFRLSLSVQKANRAYHMYRKLGFEVLHEKDEEYIMVKDLTGLV